jgi:signal transduction histidine kinase
MANELLYTRTVVLKRLSWQLAFVMLVVALVPLAVAGFLTLSLLVQSAWDQAIAHQRQLGEAAAALVRNHIREGQNRLRLIATRLPKGKDPAEIGRQLDRQMDPPGLFLEIGLVEVQGKPEVVAQSQQSVYNEALNKNSSSSRSFNPRLNQQVTQWDNGMGNIDVPLKGGEFVADALEIVQDVPALPLAVPGPEKRVLTGNLDFRPISGMLSTIAGSSRVSLSLVDKDGKAVASGGVPIPPRMKEIGTETPVRMGGLRVEVAQDERDALAPVREANRRAFIWFGLSAAAAIGLAALTARRIVRPIESLADAARRIAGGNLNARSGIVRDDEIGRLAAAFDGMAAAVQQLDQMKSEFVSHVSHELRTPLTSAKVALANVQEGISGKDSLGRVQEDLDRLIRMVNELLDVARIEAGLRLAKQATNLGDLVRSAAESLRPLAKVEMTVRGDGETIELDPARVQQIVVNLVDNALKYAKSRVDIEIRGREVRVVDDGPGVPPEHRERIFEKFARVEAGPKPPGAGLGLSIARKLAQLHGAALTCEGHAFVLRF